MTDFLIIGGGTAGCVLANRLSAEGADVHMLEAGPDTPPGEVPEDISDLYPRSYYNPDYMWNLAADQGGDGQGRKSPFPQGRVLGGGSSVMGMLATRGLPDDYTGWGIEGWSWEDVLPYFRRLERDRDFDGPLHGRDGPVTVRRHLAEDWPPFSRAVGEAAALRGWPMVADPNGEFGDGYCSLPISATLSHRVSSASAYLGPSIRGRKNLTIECDATVERLLFDGTRCVGARLCKDGGRVEERRARRVVVSAGAIQSPAILQRSGIGPASLMASLGITPVHLNEAVGANLQNHPVVYLGSHLRRDARQPAMIRPQFITGLRCSSEHAEGVPSDLLLLILNKSSWHGLGAAVAGIGTVLLAPRSRGGVTIQSWDPSVAPDVRFQMLTDPADLQRMVTGFQTAIDLMQDEQVRPLRHELFAAGYSGVVRRLNRPGRVSSLLARGIAALLDGPDALRHALIRYGIDRDLSETKLRRQDWAEATVRHRSFGTYHPVGTCRMGAAADSGSVVDEGCSVHGVDGLSIVDASIMPRIVRGTTNIPTIMVAERAADLLVSE